MSSPIRGPIPPYSNPPIEPQFFQPSVFDISAISLGQTTTVTTSVNNNYAIGQLVRLIIPFKFGSRSLNEQTGYVFSIPASNQVVVGINSTGADPFIASPTFVGTESQTPAQIVAVGDINSGVTNASGRSSVSNIIPGSFINISPF